jgi:hypothetical protein
MLTFHNDPVQQLKYVSMYRDARESNHLMRGDYFNKKTQQGCLVGIPTHGSKHEQLSKESGIPLWLIHMGEAIFEGSSTRKYEYWPESLFSTIPIGVSEEELLIVKHKVILFQLQHICQNTDEPLVKNSISSIVKLHERSLIGDMPSLIEWDSAALLAEYLAEYSAEYSAYDKIGQKLLELLQEIKKPTKEPLEGITPWQ